MGPGAQGAGHRDEVSQRRGAAQRVVSKTHVGRDKHLVADLRNHFLAVAQHQLLHLPTPRCAQPRPCLLLSAVRCPCLPLSAAVGLGASRRPRA